MRGGERKRPAPLEQFDQLVGQHGLLDEWTSSPEGLPQRSLYSRDNNYRYAFARWWGCKEEVLRFVVWVMLNPASRESNRKRRPTLDRIVARSREWGAEGVITVNLFAYRSPDPETLADVPDPVGPHNDQVLELLTGEAWRTVAAWGARGGLHNRST